MQEKYRRLREAAYAETFDELALDPSFRDFVCLYLAEGYKRNRNTVSVCNSDPAVVVLCDRWVWRCVHGVLTVHVGDTLLRARLQAWMDRLRDSWL